MQKWQSYSPVLLIVAISVSNLVMIGRHLTTFVTSGPYAGINYEGVVVGGRFGGGCLLV